MHVAPEHEGRVSQDPELPSSATAALTLASAIRRERVEDDRGAALNTRRRELRPEIVSRFEQLALALAGSATAEAGRELQAGDAVDGRFRAILQRPPQPVSARGRRGSSARSKGQPACS